MDDQGFAALKPLTDLTSLGLAGCVALTQGAVALLAAHVTGLSSLKLGGCSRVATVTDSHLLHLQSLATLTHLDLAGCLEITDAGRALT